MIGSLQTFEKPQAVAYSDRFSQIAGEAAGLLEKEVSVVFGKCLEVEVPSHLWLGYQ